MKWENVKVGMRIQNKDTGDVVTVRNSLDGLEGFGDLEGFLVTGWADSDGYSRCGVYRHENYTGSGDGINNWRKVKVKEK